jgi:hypothetical protein
MWIARRDASGSVYYFLSDRLGNAKVLTNSTGGVERPITDTLDNKFKFTGHERDSERRVAHVNPERESRR